LHIAHDLLASGATGTIRTQTSVLTCLASILLGWHFAAPATAYGDSFNKKNQELLLNNLNCPADIDPLGIAAIWI
jgi:hypothetical protein